MVKIQTDPKIYAVERDGVLRWVSTPDIAVSMYGKDRAKKVDDLSDAFFADYTAGAPITAKRDCRGRVSIMRCAIHATAP